MGWRKATTTSSSSSAMDDAFTPILSDDSDDTQLLHLGHKPELARSHSRLSILGMAFAILNSWAALSTSLSLALPSGGTSAVLWGLLISGACNLCLAASLGEFLSAYPTAGGQYHWISVLAPSRYSRVLSYSTGWISVTGWLFLVGTGGTLGSGIVLSIASLLYLDYLPSPIQIYTIYTLITLMALATNLWLTHLLPSLTRAAFIWSLIGILTLSLISLLTTPSYSSPSEIFLGFQNATGWGDGFAWLLGLLQGALALTGYDTVAHMCEEIHKPSYHGPVVMMCAVALGCGTGLLFLLSLLFSATDIPAVITAPEGPLLRILLQATGSVGISVALQVFPLGCLLFATTGIMTTASRMVFAFSRDGGLPFSTVFSRSTQGVPVPALLLTAAVVEVVGLLYFLSERVLEALVSAAVVSLSISYALPVMVNMICRRRKRLEEGVFVVPGVWGWGVNIVGAGFAAFTVVLFLLPTRWPVTTGNMNYACVGLMGIALVSWVDWVARGKRSYVGPKIEDRLSGEGGEQEGLLDEEVP